VDKKLSEPLSYSRISTFYECPQQYEFKYVKKIETPPHWYFSYGKSIHAVLERLLQCHVGPDSCLYAGTGELFGTSLQQMLEEVWLHEGYQSPESEARYHREALRVLTGFFPIFQATWQEMLYTERLITTEVDGIPFTGIVDRIDRIAEGLYRIVDYKSSRPREAATLKSHRFQVALYAAALAQDAEFREARFVLQTYYLRENLKAELNGDAEEYIAKSRQVLVKAASHIARGDFRGRRSSKCFSCDFRNICPVFKRS
jgi:ATP-dependent helicase/DNAse subunit B